MTREQRAEIARRNAAKSTGPKSAHGKAASSRNALKHGRYAAKSLDSAAARAVAEHEDRHRFLSIARRNLQLLGAQTAFERDLAISLADTQWRFERWNDAETKLLSYECRQLKSELADFQAEGFDLNVTAADACARSARALTGRGDFLKRISIERSRLLRERTQHLQFYKIMRAEFPQKSAERTRERSQEQSKVLSFPAAASD